MSLESEVQKASQEIYKDGYEMSIGELMSLYKERELIINPEFQRYFRWNITRKSKFIESILLGIPIPPIFVYQNRGGVWELIDGLQRLSTIFEFAGILLDHDGTPRSPSTLEGTKMLPSLAGIRWCSDSDHGGLSKPLQLEFKRARIRVEILAKDSDAQSKFELFQRLNTGGEPLTEQEIRNCILIQANPAFYRWLRDNAAYLPFKNSTSISKRLIREQKDLELLLRYLVIRNFPYHGSSDVHEYLKEGMLAMATWPDQKRNEEKTVFERVFTLLERSLGIDCFRRFDGCRFRGPFLVSAFEAVSVGVAENLREIEALGLEQAQSHVISKIKAMWSQSDFTDASGAGVSGATRLLKLIPFANAYFRP